MTMSLGATMTECDDGRNSLRGREREGCAVKVPCLESCACSSLQLSSSLKVLATVVVIAGAAVSAFGVVR